MLLTGSMCKLYIRPNCGMLAVGNRLLIRNCQSEIVFSEIVLSEIVFSEFVLGQ
jgi:hypothetical protein